ncbi:GAF domain-containing protein [Pseudoduganella lurida]|uniref:GAF domain-containing protein n=1 Tax=Pseudoduganella lurida TaxID=1036180 RepID=A0A562RK37_9BURK|nr:GAF domain-containing protein [Pseudoduganella lurida]TWI69409.1 GAF domain-containing protein [Pseudoduganella lurida]
MMATGAERKRFLGRLHGLVARIAATGNPDDIMLAMSAELCDVLGADRITVYALADDGAALLSKLKTGLASFKQLKLPVTPQSIAGYVALSRRPLNLADVYDEAELKRHDSQLCFQQGVDRRTGYRTRQMLVVPVLSGGTADRRLLGVLQLINNTAANGPFAPLVAEGAAALCEAIAAIFARSPAQVAPAPSNATVVRPAAPPASDETRVAAAVLPLVERAVQGGLRELHVRTEPGPDGSLRFTVTGVLGPG